MKSKNVLSKAKERIYARVITPKEIYGCQKWKMNISEKEKLEIWEKKVLSEIYDRKRIGGYVEERNQRKIKMPIL